MSDIFKNLPNDIKSVVINKLCDNGDNHKNMLNEYKVVFDDMTKCIGFGVGRWDGDEDLLYLDFDKKVYMFGVFKRHLISTHTLNRYRSIFTSSSS